MPTLRFDQIMCSIEEKCIEPSLGNGCRVPSRGSVDGDIIQKSQSAWPTKLQSGITDTQTHTKFVSLPDVMIFDTSCSFQRYK